MLLGDALGFFLLSTGAYAAALARVPAVAEQVYPVSIMLAPALFLVLGFSGFYHSQFIHPAIEMRRLATVVGTMTGTAVLTVLLATQNPNAVLLVATAGAIGTVALPIVRGLTRIVFARWSWWGLPTVVVSSEEGRDDILDTLNRWPEIGLRPVAVLSDSNGQESSFSPLEDPGWASHLSRKFDASHVIISVPGLSHARRAKLFTQYTQFFDNVFFANNASGSPALWDTGMGDGLRGYEVRSGATSQRGAWILKRLLDFVGAGLALLFLAPIFAIIAVLLQLDSPGPVFYRQVRMGMGGRPFTVLKFRSMHHDAEEKLDQVLDRDPERRREYRKYHKLDDDPRVTSVGRFLRRFSLDELPQLLNVIRGEMSLVGPRPYMPSESPEMDELEEVILDTPPGITGLWQVSGRNRLSFDERVDLDVHYFQNWSLWLDVYLLIRTIPTILTDHGRSQDSRKSSRPTRDDRDRSVQTPVRGRKRFSSPLLATDVSLPDRPLWFGRAELHDTCIRISGWRWTGPYEEHIDLADLDQVETRPRAEGPNLIAHPEGTVQPLRLAKGVMLWHWKLKEMGVDVVG